jgi:hypothetical protein
MTGRGQSHFWAIPVVGASLLLHGTLLAQTATNPAAQPRVKAIQSPVPPPLLSASSSPVAYFRQLLAASSMAEVNSLLTGRPPDTRKAILAKVREYKSLKPDQRELRLRVTELRWYLLPLLKRPATNRLDLLQRIPPDDRALVEDRLTEWDKLPAELQKQLLDNEATLRSLTELQASTNAIQNLTPARRQKLQEGIDQWNQLTQDQRQKVAARFNQFFDLRPQEKDAALEVLSEPERRQIEKTLQAFGKLSPAQRSQCIRSFEKFASFSLQERQQFLKNAERWKLMSPTERQAWRDLVNQAPMLPTLALRHPPPPMPPIPTLSRPHAPPHRLVTNGN